jgi:hypothetical protein
MVISILLLGMTMTSAISSPLKQSFRSVINKIDNDISISIKDIPPNWANGNFTGVWGIDIWGEYQIPLGWMFGYYKLGINIGYFAAGFNFFGETEISWFIQGYIFGIFMFGSMDPNEYTNQTFFVGIGNCNETDYHWRVMGEEGPVFFMNGKYTIF